MKRPVLCSTCSSSEDHIDPGGDRTASLKILSASTTSSSYSLPSTSSTSSEALSIQTFPSLPTLQPNFSAFSSQKTLPLSISCSLVHSLNNPSSSQNVLAFSQNALLLFSASPSSITVYSSQNALTPKSTLSKMPSLLSAGSVKSIAVAGPGPLLFFTAHQDGKIRAWTANNSGKVRLVSSLPTLADRILRYPIPSSHVAVRRHRRRLWIEHADAVSAVTAASGLLYSVSWDKTLKIWRLSDLRCVQSVTAHDDAVNAVAVASDGVVYTGSADTRIRVWSRSGDRRSRHFLVATLEKHRSAVNALAVSGDGRVLYSGSNDRSILVWEREESAAHMAVVGALRGHERAVMCLATAGDGVVVSGSTDRTVRVWRRGGGGYSCLCVLRGHVRGVRTVAAARAVVGEEGEEGYRVCSGSSDGEIRVWLVRVSESQRSDSE